MGERPCIRATCRHCRPGRPCAATYRWMQEEDYFADLNHPRPDPEGPTLRERLADHRPNTYIDAWGNQQWWDDAYVNGRPAGA